MPRQRCFNFLVSTLLALNHNRSNNMRELNELELEMVDGGFSLTEIMVGSSILSGVSLAVMNLSKNLDG